MPFSMAFAPPPRSGASPSSSGAPQFIVQRIRQIQQEPRAAVDPIATARRGTSDAGEPLPHFGTLQRAFGDFDLSSVRVHRGASAQRSALELSAAAYTHGEHIGLRGPATLSTLAHEAAHVVQQRQGGLRSGLSEPGESSERAAAAVADRVTRGASAVDLLSQGGGKQASAGSSDAVQRMVDEKVVRQQLDSLNRGDGKKSDLRKFLADCLRTADNVVEAVKILRWFITYTDKSTLLNSGGAEALYGSTWAKFPDWGFFPFSDDTLGMEKAEQGSDKESSSKKSDDQHTDDLLNEMMNEENEKKLPVDQSKPEEKVNQQVNQEDKNNDNDNDDDDQVLQEMIEDGTITPQGPSGVQVQESISQPEPQHESSDETNEKKPKKTKNLDKISKCLKAAHKAYADTEAKAMMTEKLVYAFMEDRDYVKRRAAILLTESQNDKSNVNSESMQKLSQQLEDNDQLDLPKPEKESKAQKKHQIQHDDKYATMLPDLKSAQEEEKTATYWVDLTLEAMQKNYLRRDGIMLLYKEIESLRKSFPLQGVFMDIFRPGKKAIAQKTAADYASQALELKELADQDYVTIRARKADLIQKRRIAPEFTENWRGWMSIQAGPKLRNKLADFGVGMMSMGFGQVKDEHDYRGFILPMESSMIFTELQESGEKILNEHSRIKNLLKGGYRGAFKACDQIVQVLQLLDRAVLTGVKRIVRFLKYYLTLIATFPPATIIASALAAAASVISGSIAVVQAALNAVISAIRSVQLFENDPAIENILLFSRRNAAINGMFSFGSLILNGAQDMTEASSQNFLHHLEKDSTANNLHNPYKPEQIRSEKQSSGSSSLEDRAQRQGMSFGINTAPDVALKFSKEMAKEYGKAKINYVKAFGGAVKGNVVGHFLPNKEQKEDVDPETLLRFNLAFGRLTEKIGTYSVHAQRVSRDTATHSERVDQAVDKTGKQLSRNNSQPDNVGKLDEAQSTAKKTRGSLGILFDSLQVSSNILEN